jgi:hypothetical protein
MKKKSTRYLGLSLALALLLTMSVGAADEPPGGFGGGGGDVPAPPPGGGSMSFYTGDAVTDLESGDYTQETFPDSTGETEVALRVGPGVTATLADSTVTKTAGDLTGDDGSFYGVNSGVLAYSEDETTPADLTIQGGKVETSANGANGVFAYGDATISLKDATVTTTGESGAGGIMVAGGGTLYAEDCTVTTEGGSSAAIRSDRGSGTMVVNGGTYIANGSKGIGSPAIYCVADITVSNATMQANNAQALCFEGRNPAHIYNSYLEGNYTASDDDENSNVMIYQSMSGDAAEGTSYCTMVGGVLKANNVSENGNAKMFYTTNTYCYISLSNVEMIYPEGMETFLLCACNTNERGWGTAGANGSECVLYTVEQDMQGNIVYDTWSYLGVYMTQGSTLNGAILCREDNGDRGCDVYLDATAVWTVTGDSLVRDLYTGGASILDDQGKTVTIVASDGTQYVTGDSAYTITVTGTFGEEDLTAYENVPGIGTVADGEYTFDTDVSGYVNLDYIPTAPDGTVYTEAAWEGALVEASPEDAAEPASDLEETVEAPVEEATEEAAEAPAEEAQEAPAETTQETEETPVQAETAETQSSSGPIIAVVVILVVLVAVIAVVVIQKKKKK